MSDPFARFADAPQADPFSVFKDAPAPQEGPKVSGLEASLRGAAQGLTMDWGDELYGYATNLPKWLTEGKDAYLSAAAKDTKIAREGNKRAREQHPGKFIASEVAGALLPTVAAALIPGGQPVAAANATRTAAQAATLTNRAYQSGKVGAGYGAVYGAGAAESRDGASLPEVAMTTAQGAGSGAAAGAVIGAAIPPVMDIARAVASPLTNYARAKLNPQGVAADKVAEAFRRDNPNVGNPIDRSAEVPGLYREPDAMIADLGGENVRGKLRSALNVPNDEKTRVTKVLDDRQKAQHAKIEAGMVEALGDPNKFHQTSDALIKVKEVQARPAFEKAFNAPFDYDAGAFRELWQRPAFDKIKNLVEDALMNEGVQGAPRTGEVFNAVRPLEIVHRIKVELDRQIGQAAKAEKMGTAGGASADKFDLRTLMTLKNDLRAAIDASGGAGPRLYERALKQYGDSSSLSRALELGYDHAASKEAPEVIRQTMAKMSPPERELYRMGQSRKMAEQNRSGRYTADRVGRDWSSPERALTMDEIAKTPADRQKFQELLDALGEQVRTRHAAQGNSTTAKQLLEAADDRKPADMLRMGTQAAMGHWNALMQSMAQKAAPLGGMTPEVAAEMLKLLSSPVSPLTRAGSAVNGGSRSSASMLPYNWGAKNAAAGLPSLQSALDRRAAQDIMDAAIARNSGRAINALYAD